MPPALSQDAQVEIDAMIDELAGPEAENVVEISSGRWLARMAIGGGIAAAIGAMFAISPVFQSSENGKVAVAAPVPSRSGLVLVSESDRIDSMTDEGWQENPDGSAMRALRLNAVEENNVRDEETGMEVLISEAREEILLMPISAF
jgi:hypothetical protein